MKVWIVLRMEAWEGGDAVAVYDSEEKALQFVKDHPLDAEIDYYEIEEWEVK